MKEKQQTLKMLIGAISKGEAAQEREGSRQAGLCEESLRDKVKKERD